MMRPHPGPLSPPERKARQREVERCLAEHALLRRPHPIGRAADAGEDLGLRLRAALSLVAEAFANGAASGVMMRFDTTPDAPFIPSFLDFRPQDAATRVLWDRMVKIPVETALRVDYPVLRQADRLGEIFPFQHLTRLALSLKESGA